MKSPQQYVQIFNSLLPQKRITRRGLSDFWHWFINVLVSKCELYNIFSSGLLFLKGFTIYIAWWCFIVDFWTPFYQFFDLIHFFSCLFRQQRVILVLCAKPRRLRHGKVGGDLEFGNILLDLKEVGVFDDVKLKSSLNFIRDIVKEGCGIHAGILCN